LGPYAEPGEHPWHRLERGEIPFRDLCVWASEEGARRGWKLDLSPLPALMNELAIRPQAIELVRRVRAEGYSTALVTNNVREFGVSWRAQLPLDELFDAVVDSCEVGLRKPDERFYRFTLERLGGLSPGEAVLLDDFPDNVRGAEQIGMAAVLVGPDWNAAVARLDELLDAARAR
jgi:putative hydrolase of the HAD superfamily